MDIKQGFFKESDIPYDDLKKLGISKLDVLSLDKQNLDALLNGKRTRLFEMTFSHGNDEPYSFKGRLSLYHKEDGSTGLRVHPVRKDIENDMKLKDKEIERLKSGELISKSVGNEKYIVQLDRETNELLKVKTKNIVIPTYIKDVELNNKQIEALKSGQSIQIGAGKDKVDVKLDLNSPRGVNIIDFEQKKKLEYDLVTPGVTDAIHTDKNRAEKIEYIQKQDSKKSIKL